MEYTPVFSSNNDNTISFSSRPALVCQDHRMELWVLRFMRDADFTHIDDYHIIKNELEVKKNTFWATQNDYSVVMHHTEDFVMMKLTYG